MVLAVSYKILYLATPPPDQKFLKSGVSLSKARSILTSKSKIPKGLSGAFKTWDRINKNYLNKLEKEMSTIEERFEKTQIYLIEFQKKFVKIFQRDNRISMKLVKFVDNYTKFVNDHPKVFEIESHDNKKSQKITKSFIGRQSPLLNARGEILDDGFRSKNKSSNFSSNSGFLGQTRSKFRQVQKTQSFINENYDKVVKLINKKLEDLHDSIWEIIEDKKNKADEEKRKFKDRKQLEKDIEFFLHSYLNLISYEIGKIVSIKKFLITYHNWKYGYKESELDFPMRKVELNANSLPKIEYREEEVPTERIDYIYERANYFIEGMRESLDKKKDDLPEEYNIVLNKEIEVVIDRIDSLKCFITSQIRILKVRYTLFTHRLEDWMIESIREQNLIVYEFIKYIKDSIAEKATSLDINNKSYDPLEANPLIEFKNEPYPINFPHEEYHLEHIPSLTQLYLILADLVNLKGAEDKINAIFNVEDISKHLFSRLKKNDEGFLDYFPKEWSTMTLQDFEKAFNNISYEGDEGEINTHGEPIRKVNLATFCLCLILLRYPIPSLQEVHLLEKAFASKKIRQSDFELQACWLDEFEEKLIDGLGPNTLYKTVYTKRFIWWLFSNNDEFDSESFLTTLKNISGSISSEINDTFFDKLFGFMHEEYY